MKKLYKKALVTLTVLSVGATPCFAAPALTARIDENVTIQMVTDAENPDYLIYILEPGAEMENVVQASEKKLNGLYMLEEFSASPVQMNGEYRRYSLNFPSEGLPAGTYTVVAAGKGKTGEQTEVTRFVVPEQAEEAAALAAITSSPTAATLQSYQNKAWYVDFENETYKAHGSQVLESFAAICQSPENGSAVQADFELACVLTELRYADSDKIYDLLYQNEEVLGVSYCDQILSKDAGFLLSFTDLRSDSALNPVRTTEELNTLLYRAEALSQVNAATRETFADTLKTYESVFGLSGVITGVDSYNLAKEAMMTNGNRYKTVNEVIEAVKKAAEKLRTPQAEPYNPGSGGSGGGGGGWGGSSGRGGGITASGVEYSGTLTADDMNEISPPETGAGGFVDLDEAKWAEGYIAYMNYAGIMTGDGDGSFRPADSISREEFAKALMTALKLSTDYAVKSDEPTFADVDPDAWYYDTVRIAYLCGIINGMDKDTFGIGQPIARQDAVAMVDRARLVMKMAYKAMGDSVTFTDQDTIAEYARDAINNVQRAGVISGYEDGSFQPNNTITRAETAKLIYSLMESLSLL